MTLNIQEFVTVFPKRAILCWAGLEVLILCNKVKSINKMSFFNYTRFSLIPSTGTKFSYLYYCGEEEFSCLSLGFFLAIYKSLLQKIIKKNNSVNSP